MVATLERERNILVMDVRPSKRARADVGVAEDDSELCDPPACVVRPMGNRILGDGAVEEVDRDSGLGSLGVLGDMTILRCLQWLTPEELCPVIATSKALYVLGTWDSL